MRLRVERRASPVGTMLLAVDDEDVLRALDFEDCEPRFTRLLLQHYPDHTRHEARVPRAIRDALDAYFAGQVDALDALPIATGGTPFQRAVWAALRRVPYGTTTSYGALAAALGRPSAARAVGLANSLNPIGIVVPCHRVIGVKGALTGYAGGLHRKRWLLEHELRYCASPPTLARRTTAAM